MSSAFSRGRFLSAAGVSSIGLAVAGCSGTSFIVPSAGGTKDLASLMRAAGASYVIEKGMIYHADGRVNFVVKKPQCSAGLIPWVHERTTKCDVPTDNPDHLTVIGCTSTSYGPTHLLPSINAAGGYNGMRPQVGADYGVDATRSRDCRADLAAAAAAAWSMVTYMRANSGTYSSAINNAVNAVFNKYQGTTMGVAASIEFVIAIMAGLGIGEVLAVLVGAGLVIGTVWVLVDCYGAG